MLRFLTSAGPTFSDEWDGTFAAAAILQRVSHTHDDNARALNETSFDAEAEEISVASSHKILVTVRRMMCIAWLSGKECVR